jgi:hypothetical protein
MSHSVSLTLPLKKMTGFVFARLKREFETSLGYLEILSEKKKQPKICVPWTLGNIVITKYLGKASPSMTTFLFPIETAAQLMRGQAQAAGFN